MVSTKFVCFMTFQKPFYLLVCGIWISTFFSFCIGTHPMLCYTLKQAIELQCRAYAWLVKAKWSPDTYQMTDTVFQYLRGGGGGQFNLGKRMNKIKYDVDNADQNVKWFLKVHRAFKLLWEACFKFSFSQVFIQVHILQIFRYSPPPPPDNES